MGIGGDDLVRRAAGGDDDALGRLAALHRADITRTVSRYLHSPDDVEDAVQETLVRAIEFIEQLRHPEAFGGWLQGIAANVCREALRQRSRIASCDVQTDSVPSQQHEAQVALPERDKRSAMRALAALPFDERALLVLYCLEGASIAEVAALYGVSESAVKMRVLRAREMAREVVLSVHEVPGDKAEALSLAYHSLALRYAERQEWAKAQRCWQESLSHAPRLAGGIWRAFRASVYAGNVSNILAIHTDPAKGAVRFPSACSAEGVQAAMEALRWGLRRHLSVGVGS